MARGTNNRWGWLALCLLMACADARVPPDSGEATPATSTRSASAGNTAQSSASPAASATGSATAAKSSAPRSAPPLALGGKRVISSRGGLVSSEDPYATRIGVQVLEAGGNAIDAAVAVGYALSVTHHAAGSLGGGGFMLIQLASGEAHALDYREVAPAKATKALNDEQLNKGAHGYLSAPVPGVVAGLNLARARFGTKPLKELLEPSIALARDGHRYGQRQALVMSWFYPKIRRDPVMRAIFGRGPGRKQPLGAGALLRQPRLAETLQAIADRGDAGFYQGAVAQKIARAHKRNGGIVSEADLAAYRAKLRAPLRFHYRGYDILTMPPPSMGGIALLSIMRTLAASKAHQHKIGSADSLHLFIEAARRSYADRRAIGADPDVVGEQVAPLRKQLLSARYYKQRKPAISLDRATPSEQIVPIQRQSDAPRESPDTTHFSVVDAQGNAVACTTTLSAAYGAWVVVPQTGILLSNAMGGFSPSGSNALAPGKRMASSMTPTIVLRDGRAVAVLGSPGGDTIPNSVAQVLRNLIDGHMTLDKAIETGRIHHQYKPDQVRVEKKRPPTDAVIKELEQRGHKLVLNRILIGDVNGIVFDPSTGTAYGVSDARKGGLALGAKPADKPAK